jgi:NADH-quinone oxidoreductase subunit H
MFMLAEFMAVITMSAIIVTLFLGGPQPVIPSPFGDGTFLTALWGMGAFLTKVFVFVFIFIWLRGSLPRLRYDRLMDLGWKVLLPFGLAWVLLSGAAVVYQNSPDNRALIPRIGAVMAIALVIYLVAPMFDRKDSAAQEPGGGGGGATALPPPGDGPGGATALPATTTEGGDDPADQRGEPVGASQDT